MPHRIVNFNAGPATLPLEVLKKAQSELLDYHGTGMSVMEISHRSAEYDEINNSARNSLRDAMGLSDEYEVLFLGGGASTQFAMVPLNLLGEGQTAAYVDTGEWSSRAIKEAKKIGKVHLAGSSAESNYTSVPKPDELSFPDDAAYLHMTSNNTIHGTQFHRFPETGEVPLVCDMSSDILSRRIDFSRFDLIYAGSQKNLGPAGVTIVIIKGSLLSRCRDDNPTMLSYRTHADKQSLYNTPPVFAVYLVKLVIEWLVERGGLEAIEKENRAKQELVYRMMEQHPDFYKGTADPTSRSWMNLTMRLPDEELEKKFVTDAKSAGFGGLKGHRSVGGIRVSLYNAMPLESVEKLVRFMEEFRAAN